VAEDFHLDLYLKVRLACSEGMSQREAAKHFNLRATPFARCCRFRFHRATGGRLIKRPKLDGFTSIIDSIREADRAAPLKQRHTAKRIFDRLKKEFGFTGGYTIVKNTSATTNAATGRCSCPGASAGPCSRRISAKPW
jgi:transposase